MEDKYLPVGTVVLLKGGKKELMINSFCVVPQGVAYGKEGKVELEKGQMFDYGACPYPEGMVTSDQAFVFNHDQIERICFKGYETEQSKQMSEFLKNNLKELDKLKEGNQEELVFFFSIEK
jgi:hypothetical protein